MANKNYVRLFPTIRGGSASQSQVLKIAEEFGEFVQAVNHFDKTKAEILEELVDLMQACETYAINAGEEFEEAYKAAIDKNAKRGYFVEQISGAEEWFVLREQTNGK